MASGNADPKVREKVAKVWAPRDLRDKVAAALKAAGRDHTNTSVEELAEFDQYHVLGPEGTVRLARQIGIKAGDRVLDVGSGMGGPARMLASEFGCEVQGIDLTPAFFETAELLNEVTGLSDRVSFQLGDATDLPFDDATFDVAWTMNITQSVPEKEQLFAEMARVLKPGGALALQDGYRANPDVPFTYPAIWDPDGSITFIESAEKMRALIEGAGFEIENWTDITAPTREWLADELEALSAPPDPDAPPAAIPDLDYMLFFSSFEEMHLLWSNVVIDFDSGAFGFFEAVVRKAA